ncbi:flagellar biosynthesis protein FlhF [Oceanicoccus sp. KOV_DT_Chl]|uniref:flagellar biosynthesis protein FlhF n=1 Tax=Oceanicoccus sp. KOV_DT_Chl TaxID=1904639 RepID=UPI000C7A879A|nr:flagellar biosynthesis protein FlhF [Oceanicoccus sp. KOV_DT_Chl]
MQVKRFVAANMRLALEMVREEMGPEAVILSNKRVPDGVELLTAIDPADIPEPESSHSVSDNPFEQAMRASQAAADAESRQRPPSKLELGLDLMQHQAKERAKALAAAMAEKNRQQIEAAVNPAAVKEAALADAGLQSYAEQQLAARLELDVDKVELQAVTPESVAPAAADMSAVPVRDEELIQMRFELQAMRDLLEQQLSTMAWGNYSQQQPERAGIWKRLKRMGISASLADSLLAKAQLQTGNAVQSVQVWQAMMADLCQQLQVESNDLVDQGGVFAFVGPTGAGKTTTIGKLAARYVLKHGAENVALVTTDTMRIAAHEQLRTFGRILNLPVKIVDKNNSLERVLHSLRHKKLVLVDTAGLNRQDPRLRKQMHTLNELGGRLRTVLVLPTTSQVEVIRAAYHTYKTDSLDHCVLTKLDEAASLGEAISLAVEQSLTVAYSTAGQAIPDDISCGVSNQLVRTAIELAKQVTTDDETMAEELAGLGHTKVSAQRLSANG